MSIVFKSSKHNFHKGKESSIVLFDEHVCVGNRAIL